MTTDAIEVRTESPKPPALAAWDDYGSPAERIPTSDSRWTWAGPWLPPPPRTGLGKRATAKGAEGSVTFTGTGVILVGPHLAEGGKADVYLDGALQQTVDVNSDEDQGKGGESIWHAFGLANRAHTLRVVVRGEAMYSGKGTDVEIEDLVVFRP